MGDVPVRLGQADCEVWFGVAHDEPGEELLFHDYLLPVSSPENNVRISNISTDDPLEGFPLLHLDCYTRSTGAIGWPEWIKMHGYRKTASGRGIRYKQVIQALEAVYSNAGLIICGIGLVQEQLDSGSLSLPFPLAEGKWSEHAYYIRFRGDALRRSQTSKFRDWLLSEASKTQQHLQKIVSS